MNLIIGLILIILILITVNYLSNLELYSNRKLQQN